MSTFRLGFDEETVTGTTWQLISNVTNTYDTVRMLQTITLENVGAGTATFEVAWQYWVLNWVFWRGNILVGDIATFNTFMIYPVSSFTMKAKCNSPTESIKSTVHWGEVDRGFREGEVFYDVNFQQWTAGSVYKNIVPEPEDGKQVVVKSLTTANWATYTPTFEMFVTRVSDTARWKVWKQAHAVLGTHAMEDELYILPGYRLDGWLTSGASTFISIVNTGELSL